MPLEVLWSSRCIRTSLQESKKDADDLQGILGLEFADTRKAEEFITSLGAEVLEMISEIL